MNFFTRHKRLTIWVCSVLTLIAALYFFGWEYPFRGTPFHTGLNGTPPLTPRWALECWLWEDDNNTADYVDTLRRGYAAHDIPVRTLMIDSPWSTRYNDFNIDTTLYPKQWFRQLQDEGYRVVLWMTSLVNAQNPDTKIGDSKDWHTEAKERGYLAKGDKLNKWWKGKGGYIDYSNPEAMKWWRGMQQEVFDLGLDGWKLDGAATLFANFLGPVPIFYKQTYNGWMTTRTYMNHYYRDEYQHGLTQNPEFITLARSIDQWIHPEGFAPLDAAPVTWVGDQRHQWVSDEKPAETDNNKDLVFDGVKGFEMAIENILEAARLGYCIIGSDVAGYQGGYIPPRLYMRWAQFSCFNGLFLNGGHGERALWKRTEKELDVIRKFSWLHTELVPYIHAYVVQAHRGGRVLQQPLKQGRYHYLFGDDFLVAPIYKDVASIPVTLPEGEWRYFFNDKERYAGSQTFTKEYPLDESPVFIREGAIVPMNISRGYTAMGDTSSNGYTTWVIYPSKANRFTIYSDDLQETTLAVSPAEGGINISLSGQKQPHILRIDLPSAPRKVSLDDNEMTNNEACHFDAAAEKLIIKTENYIKGNYLIEL